MAFTLPDTKLQFWLKRLTRAEQYILHETASLKFFVIYGHAGSIRFTYPIFWTPHLPEPGFTQGGPW